MNLKAEEQEEEDVQATKNDIRDIKRRMSHVRRNVTCTKLLTWVLEDVSETRNALRIAAQAEETGRATLERLGIQGERIHTAEKVQQRIPPTQTYLRTIH